MPFEALVVWGAVSPGVVPPSAVGDGARWPSLSQGDLGVGVAPILGAPSVGAAHGPRVVLALAFGN